MVMAVVADDKLIRLERIELVQVKLFGIVAEKFGRDSIP